MADYEGLIRVGIQGLNQIKNLEKTINASVDAAAELEKRLDSIERKQNRSRARITGATRNLGAALNQIVETDQGRDPKGRILPGASPAERRAAARNLTRSELRLKAEERSAAALERARRIYIATLGRVNAKTISTTPRLESAMSGLDAISRKIGQQSRINYLTNLFQGRQREFSRGGAGAGLPRELQQQARNTRAAFDLASAGGKENLQLMQRLATEMAGIVRQQNELNRLGAGRSVAFEAGRRGQERITDLSQMPGADPARIRRLRSLATNAIAAGFGGDIAGSRELTRRMNASISRYERELNAAATELAQQRRAGMRGLNVQQSWRQALSGLAEIQATGASAASGRNLNRRQGWQQALAGMAEIQVAGQGRAGAARMNRRQSWQQALAGMAEIQAGGQARTAGRSLNLRQSWQSALSELSETADLIRSRQAATRQSWQAALSGMTEIQAAGQVRGNFRNLGVQESWRRLFEDTAPEVRGRQQADAERRRRQEERRQQQARQQGFFRGDARKAIGEGLIGGAFPLLFGQGLGASIGGFAGGATGGLIGGSFGFGLSLVGTAVGQAVDNTSSSLKELAASLKSPTDAIAALEASGFRVSDSIKFQVQQLQSVGRAYDAQTLALREVQKRLGPGAITELAQLDAAQKNLQEQWGAIAAEIQVRLIPVLQGFVEFLGSAADDIGGFANQSRLQRLDPNKFEQLRTQAIRETARGPFGSFGDKKAFDARLNELSRQELSRRFAGERGKVKLSPQEAAADVETQVQESRKIADQVQSAYREAFKLQRQAYDLQRDGAEINKEIADYNYKKEQQIFDLRQQAAEKEIENRRGRAQNRIESGDLNLRQAFAGAVGFEQQLLSNVREVMRTRMEGEADIEQSRKKLELAMAKLNRDAEDYKRTTSREIDDIERRKLAYVRSVEDYKMQVADYVLQRARESADLTRQAMTLPDMGTGGAAPTGAGSAGGGSMGGTKLSRLIGSHESYGGNYGAFNRGGTNQGHTAFGSGIDPNLVNMTIAEIQRRQLAPGVPANQQLHAVGKYQIIGSTLRSLMQGRYGATGVSPTDRFTPDVQERLGAALARNRVQGRSVEEGMRGLRQEWIGLQYASNAKLREAVIELQGTGNLQGVAASQVSNVPQPKFTPVPIGATPAAAPINAARMNALSRMAGGEKEAQKILEDQIKLKEKGVELGQIEQILQGNQLPQLEQQGDALRRQVEARRQVLSLNDKAASAADLEAEREARLLQILKDRKNALEEIQKKITNPKDQNKAVRLINQQTGAAIGIAVAEEEQRRKNLSLTNELQNQDRVRTEILQLQENLAIAQAEAVALETGRLEAKNSELLKASTLYREADDAQRARLEALTIETEELQKQNEFRKQANQLRLDAQLTGAGLRAGFVGVGARAFEQGMRDFDGNTARATELANQAKVLENQQLVWGRLEQNIVDVSEAISGGLTNGLLDIVSGAKSIEDVGREMLSRIAGTFAESAQQQLSTLMQRQLGGLLGGAQGPLVKMLGGGAEVAGSQGLGAASAAAAGSVWGLSGAAVAAGAALQAIAGQAAFSGSLAGFGGLGSFGGIAGSAFSGGGSGNILDTFLNPPNVFGGFMASGGVTSPNKGYVVGENEPEFFFPGVTGRVVPASDMQKAAALQQANASNEPIDVRYTVTEQRGERYVTEQQFREGMAATSKRAQAMTYAGMRNNKNIRDYVAI